MEDAIVFSDKTFHKNIYQEMVDNEEHQFLIQTLIRIQAARGIRIQEAAERAQFCIAAVTGCENIRSNLVENHVSMVEKVLDFAEKVFFGTIVTSLGAIMAAVSQQTANLIGKFRTGFTADKEPAKAGLQQLASYQEALECPIAEQAEQRTMQEENQQLQPAILGIM